ncbi:hypothetical protein PG995_007388 [Apiospora arundinis]
MHGNMHSDPGWGASCDLLSDDAGECFGMMMFVFLLPQTGAFGVAVVVLELAAWAESVEDEVS